MTGDREDISKSTRWKFTLVLLVVLVGTLAWLVFGERGLWTLEQKQREYMKQKETVRLLEEENRALQEEIRRLKHDSDYQESTARRERGLLKDNEKWYRFGDRKQEEVGKIPVQDEVSGPDNEE